MITPEELSCFLKSKLEVYNNQMAKLTAADRNKIPAKSFALLGKRAYPIPDRSHAENALSRVSQFGTAAQKAKVRSAVKRKFPSMGKKK